MTTRYCSSRQFVELDDIQRRGVLSLTPVRNTFNVGRFLLDDLSYRSVRVDRLLRELGHPMGKYLEKGKCKRHFFEL